MRQDGEPSVDEILQSIKKVMARDNRQLAEAEQRRRAGAGVGSTSRRTDRRADRPADRQADRQAGQRAASTAGMPEKRAGTTTPEDDILDLGSAAGDPEDTSGEPGDDGLTNEGAARAMRDSLSALAMMAEPGAPPQIVRSGETSLEGLVRDMLRPMLARWLDDNLPEMVEKLVKAEIARIARKGR